MISYRQADYDNFIERGELKKDFETRLNKILKRGNLLMTVILLRVTLGVAKYNPDSAIYKIFEGLPFDPSLFPDRYQDILSQHPKGTELPLKKAKDMGEEILHKYHAWQDYRGVRVQIINEDDFPSDHAGEIKDYKMNKEGRGFSWVSVGDRQFNMGTDYMQVDFEDNELTLRKIRQ